MFGKFQASMTLAIMLLFTGCFNNETNEQTNKTPPTMPAVPVTAIKAIKSDNKMSFEYPTRLESQQDVYITPKVSGTLVAQNFKPGDKISAGDVLFVIEQDRFKATLDVAVAATANAQATLKNAKSEMDRVKKLTSQKAISQREYDAALAAFESASAALASAKASEKQAKLDYSYTQVKAPFDGVVGENLIDVGSYVNVGTSQLVRLSKINPVEARFYIADSANLDRINNLQQNKWIQLNSDARLLLEGQEFKGKISFIDNIVDNKTGSVLAKAEFKNDDHRLLPGTFAKIVMDGFVQKDSFLLPQIVIKQDVISPYVLVVADGKVVKKSVKIVYQTSSKAIISEGLNDGDIVITDNFSKIAIGASVSAEIKEQE
ncbi:Toluene efflux pump periplasmic linker protein TtgA [Campylobacter majalis]|uniref:Toluene efflux pump periplasmic linker protein TtgA n=1 Tax=Campylobacter majalis TaxID=2790656 RepID=A0ABM8Q6G2_9BACT|nr:efflux RND transporter periplasmic adaptor subunit [Campylobacter majalis]CAD7288389.1 Toluene efflux pump periplasmic linker protein TtgA [Campylobacter majalis]